jgi:uncharacterized protein DUF6789
MPTIVQHLLSQDWRPGRAATAGLVATAAYSVAMETDQHITDNHFNDVTFIQGLLGDTRAASPRFRVLAWALHFLSGVMLAEVYAAVCKRFLPGPNWLKGMLFGGAFIAAVWPLTPFVDRYHPMIKSGQLPHLANWTAFGQNVLRHLVFGLALGLFYRKPTK